MRFRVDPAVALSAWDDNNDQIQTTRRQVAWEVLRAIKELYKLCVPGLPSD